MTTKEFNQELFHYFGYRLFEKRDIIRQDPRMLYAICEGGSGIMGAGELSQDHLGMYLQWWEGPTVQKLMQNQVPVWIVDSAGGLRVVYFSTASGEIIRKDSFDETWRAFRFPYYCYKEYKKQADEAGMKPYTLKEVIVQLFGKEALREFNEQHIKPMTLSMFNCELNNDMNKYRAGNITKKEMLESLARCGYVIISALPWREEQTDEAKCHLAQIRLEKHLQQCNYVYGSVMVEVGDETPYKTVVAPNTYVVFAAQYDKDLLGYKATDIWELCEWAKSIAPSCHQPLIGFRLSHYIEAEIKSTRTLSYICTKDQYKEQTDGKSTRKEVIMRKGKVVEKVDVNSLDAALNNYFHHLLHREKVIGRSHVQFAQSPKVPFNRRLF